jgi:four helix bundle protein
MIGKSLCEGSEMARIRRFEDIAAWQRSRELVRAVYLACADGGLQRDFGLKDQLCRSAVSVMSNIAEGFGRHSHQDFARFLDLARGSATEVQSLLYVASDVGYISPDQFQQLYRLADQSTSMIARFSAYLRQTPSHAARRTPHAARDGRTAS